MVFLKFFPTIKCCDRFSNLNPYKHFLQEDENEDEDTEYNAFDLFKICHFSKKKDGYTPAVQSAIVSLLCDGAFLTWIF
jgi:hypothetical protein